MEEADAKTKKLYDEFKEDVRKLRRRSRRGGVANEKQIKLISTMARSLMAHSKIKNDKMLGMAKRLVAIQDAAKEIKKTAPWLNSFANLFVHVHMAVLVRVGSTPESSDDEDGAPLSDSSLSTLPRPSPPPKSKKRKSEGRVVAMQTPRGRKRMCETRSSDGETDSDRELAPSGKKGKKRRAQEERKSRHEEKEDENRKIRRTGSSSRRFSSGNKSEKSNESDEEEEEREEKMRPRIELIPMSPRTKKAKLNMKKRVEVGYEPNRNCSRGSEDSWPCPGLVCSERPTFFSHVAVYRHYLKEHYMEGVLMAKCLSCSFVAPFAEVIVHRKNGEEDTCGDEEAKMLYWIEVERKKKNETDDEKEEREKVAEMEKNFRKCMHKKCRFLSTTTFEELEEHYRLVHKVRVHYVCKREGCPKTFLHPLAFIRHMNDTCINGFPKPIVRKIRERKERKGRKREERDDEEEDENMEEEKNRETDEESDDE